MKPSVHRGSLRYLMVLFRLLMEASSYSLSPYRGGGVLGLHLAPMAISAAAMGKLSGSQDLRATKHSRRSLVPEFSFSKRLLLDSYW